MKIVKYPKLRYYSALSKKRVPAHTNFLKQGPSALRFYKIPILKSLYELIITNFFYKFEL